MEEKVIIAKFGKTKVAQTEKQWRYNHGQKLKFEGVDLPANYEVHFSNSKTGTAKTMIGNADGVLIPHEYFVPGEMIYAWVYVEEDGVGVTRREVRIPIDQKARPTDQQPLPEEQTVIEQAIEALNDAVDEIPNEITTALAEAKASGLYDGTNIWWTYERISSGAPDYDGGMRKRDLHGKEGENPLIGDLVYGPDVRSDGVITDLYVIANIVGPLVYLTHLDRIVGDDGFSPEVEIEQITNGHRVTITDAEGPESFDVMNGTFEVTDDLSMENYRLTELADGVDDTDAVNKAQVEQMVREGSGLFRGSFSTKASLNMASWQSEDPTQPYYVDNNDYCIVLSDETQHYECWRYGYMVGSGWTAQYRINEAPMTAAQIAAINSGITADRLVSLEQFKNTAQPKLNGIEAGAQVNKIEKIRAWDSTAGEYTDLPISNKIVDLPQNSDLPAYHGSTFENLFLYAAYPNGNLSWENVRDIYWIDATLTNNVVTFDTPLGNNGVARLIAHQFGALQRFPVLILKSGSTTYTLPLVGYHPADLGENAFFRFCSVSNDAVLFVGLARRSNQSDFSTSYNSISLSLNGIISQKVPNPIDKDVIYYNPVTGWTAKQLEASDVSGAYEKPDTGIPAEDLDKDVPILPNGGAAFQVLGKRSDDDYDYDWTNLVLISEISLDQNDDYVIDYGYSDIASVLENGGIIRIWDGTYYYDYVRTINAPAPSTLVQLVFVCSTPEKTRQFIIGSDGIITYSEVYTYSKPSGGIPASDLASAVQTSLGKADTALQTAPVSSVNGKTGAVSLSIPSAASDVGAVAADQGIANTNKVLRVNSLGVVVPEDDRFVVTLTPTAQDYSGIMDKTVAEINAAYEAGKKIVFKVLGSVNEVTYADCSMQYANGSYTYPSFNGFIISDAATPNLLIFAFTSVTNDGTKATYAAHVYPLATGQWTGGSY